MTPKLYWPRQLRAPDGCLRAVDSPAVSTTPKHFMPNRSQFEKLLAGQPDVDLVQLMLELASDVYPDLDRVSCLLAIDQLGVVCADACAGPSARTTHERLESISHTLYEAEGFHGNADEYYDPRNSYLNEVLARRCGIPISLGILYMVVAARAGLHMFGVGAPGHFIVACQDGQRVWYVDPFNRGDVLDADACIRRVQQMAGQTISHQDLRPATPLAITARVLRNLKTAYAMQECWGPLLGVQRRLTLLLPQAPDERRDLGLVYLRVGEPARALALLEPLIADVPRDQVDKLQPSIQAARRMIAERN